MKKAHASVISLIIPAYMQEKTIQHDLLRIKKVMDQLRYRYEIIVVVDGMEDKTYTRAKKIVSKKITIVGYQQNQGKGYAIRYGMVRSKGNIIGFIDAGMDLHPSGLSVLLDHFQKYHADIIVGSKRHPLSQVNYPLQRQIISFLSQIFIRVLFGLNVTDTQVGMKFFRRKVIEDTLPRLLVKKYAIDIEVLTVAYSLGYTRIYEAPIELNANFSESVISQNLLKALFHTFWDTMTIFYRLKILHYYSDKNKKKWMSDPKLNFKSNVI